MLEHAPVDAADIVLRDGSTVRLRPLTPNDAQALGEFYERLSEQSLHNRFSGARRIEAIVDDALKSLEDPRTCSLVAESGAQLVAIGQYFPLMNGQPTRAEVAFAIADLRQGRGIGTRLL